MGFQVPAIILRELPVAPKGHGGTSIRRAAATSGDLPRTLLMLLLPPCLLTLNRAAADEVLLPSTRSYSPLAARCTVAELSHSVSLLSPNMSHHGETSIVYETGCTCNTRSPSTLQLPGQTRTVPVRQEKDLVLLLHWVAQHRWPYNLAYPRDVP